MSFLEVFFICDVYICVMENHWSAPNLSEVILQMLDLSSLCSELWSKKG